MKLHRTRLPSLAIASMLILALLTACGAPTPTQQLEPATPTPLPPAPELERPTFKVERGTIEDVLEVNGRVTPVDLVRVAFRRQGRVEKVSVKRGDIVQQGAILAELQQDDKIDDLRQAENTLAKSQRALEDARLARAKGIRRAQLTLQNAQQALARVLPGGPNDPIYQAQKDLEAAQRAAQGNKDTASTTKTDAEYGVIKAAEALQDAQSKYSQAYWDNDWVQRYGTQPGQTTTKTQTASGTVTTQPQKLSDHDKQTYKDALASAERALHDAEHGVQEAQRTLEVAQGSEINTVADEDAKVQAAQRKLNNLVKGNGNEDVISRRNAVAEAELGLEEAQQGSLDDQITQVEDAQRGLEKARKAVQDGQIIAPQNGEILSISISEGDNAEAFTPVVEIADPSKLEVGAELTGEQMRQLSEGQPAQVSLLSRPDVLMPAVIRLLPAPYGSGGSGVVAEQDKTTRFQVTDTQGQELKPGLVAKIRIVLQSKQHVLLLPPDAIRSFEGRQFVNIRTGDRESRIPVRLGIQTQERVEILENDKTVDRLKEGDVVVGQ